MYGGRRRRRRKLARANQVARRAPKVPRDHSHSTGTLFGCIALCVRPGAQIRIDVAQATAGSAARGAHHPVSVWAVGTFLAPGPVCAEERPTPIRSAGSAVMKRIAIAGFLMGLFGYMTARV